MLKRGRREEKAKDMGVKKKVAKESRCPNLFQSVYRLTVLPVCRAQLMISPQGPQNHLVIAKVSNSLLTIAPELRILFFTSFLSFVSSLNVSLVENLGTIPFTLG